MTTAWAELTRGRVLAALAANIGGVILALLAAVFGPWLIIAGWRGQWQLRVKKRERCPEPVNATVILQIAMLVLIVVVVEWGIRVFFFS